MWKPIRGYEGYYEVSTDGLVRSVDRFITDRTGKTRLLTGKVMKLSEASTGHRGGNGYLVVNLHKNHESDVVPVHRLVAETFIENPSDYPTVNHKDGNKKNNTVGNLEWASYSMNNVHALSTRLRMPRGCAVIQKDTGGHIVGVYRSVCEASRQTGIGRGIISHCVNGRANTAGEFVWEKIEKCNDYLSDESTPENELPAEVQEPRTAEDIVCSDENICVKR